MGLFGFGKNKGTQQSQAPVQQAPIQQSTGGIQLNLSKEQSLIQLDMRKREVSNLCMGIPQLNGQQSRVALVLDYSGSMRNLYKNGTVQAVIERIMPIACQFDDNQELDLWIFENGYTRLGGITMANFYGFVEREIMKYRMGGTQYAPVMQDVFNKYISEEPSDMPNYVIFITDGDNSDKRNTTALMKEASKYPVFWQFVGIGNDRFEYLEKLDDMGGRFMDNADFFQIRDIVSISDNELYTKLLTEYPSWLTEAKQKGIIR